MEILHKIIIYHLAFTLTALFALWIDKRDFSKEPEYVRRRMLICCTIPICNMFISALILVKIVEVFKLIKATFIILIVAFKVQKESRSVCFKAIKLLWANL